jgi:accessory gene regulator B
MFNKLSESLTNRLIETGIINTDELEIYRFGLETLMMKLCHLASYLLLGIFFDKLLELLLFIAAFIPLREYAGGYHAKTPLRCYLVSCLTVISLLFLLHATPSQVMNYSIILAFLASTILFFVVPVESANKPLDESEKTYYRSKAGFLIIFILTGALVSRMLDWNYLSYILALSLAYEAVIAIVGLKAGKSVHMQ